MSAVWLDIVILRINNALVRLVELFSYQYSGISYPVLVNAEVGRQ